MDRRNIYHTLGEIMSRYDDPAIDEILEDMSIASLDPYQSKNPSMFEEFVKVMSIPSIDADDYGYEYASRFYDFLCERYEVLNSHPLDRFDYISSAVMAEANIDYMILHWTVLVYSVLYSKFHPLKELYEMMKPLTKDDKVGSLYQDFMTNFVAKPVPYKNGYSYSASWLFGMGQVAQTVMTRIGETYWDGFYRQYERLLDSTRPDALSEIFFRKKQVYKSGAEIKDLLPMFVSFGFNVSFNLGSNIYSIYFPFDGYEMEDISVFKDGSEFKKFDFLDDLFKDESFEGKKLLDVFDECTNVTIVA